MIVVGIDIGLTGAFSVVMDTRLVALEDMPTREKIGSKALIRREIDGQQLAFRLRACLGDRIDEALACLENVRATPGGGARGGRDPGASSTFALGETKGVIRGVLECLGIQRRWVEPQSWKRWYGIVDDKNGKKAVLKATEIFGLDERISLVKDHNRAEAALLGRYGWQKFA